LLLKASPADFKKLGFKRIRGTTSSFGVAWRHRPLDYSIPRRPFAIRVLVLRNQTSISNGFRYIQWRMWRNGWHKLERPLCKGQKVIHFGTNRFLTK